MTGSDLTPDVNKSRIYVNMKERKDRNIIQLDSMKAGPGLSCQTPDIKSSVEMIAMVGGGMRSVPIQLMIQGRDLDDLNMRTLAIKNEFAKLPGIVDADTSIEIGKAGSAHQDRPRQGREPRGERIGHRRHGQYDDRRRDRRQSTRTKKKESGTILPPG